MTMKKMEASRNEAIPPEVSAYARPPPADHLSPLPSGERVARRAGEGVALVPNAPPRASPSP
ncbi:hypothetical protein Sp245p_30585 (plasmid) [Azospirillum baldaniorum]|uniref:Uncharacterized protein n=1 Tax=Azospirillum baldaniorum TaxID=1064539 RepID=A0A9P1JX12_9PROT|nr:hypothetical protein Sp245p_30585 [Azospirillum baldaniorum]CCD01473.1 protein of unknown function [Azospirillum baldaniorum]